MLSYQRVSLNNLDFHAQSLYIYIYVYIYIAGKIIILDGDIFTFGMVLWGTLT